MPGYDIKWKKINIHRDKIDVTKQVNSTIKTKQASDNNKLIPNISNRIGEEKNITASVDNTNLIINNNNYIIPKLVLAKTLRANQVRAKVNDGFTNKDSCDKIILKNGDIILAKITYINKQFGTILYKKCDYPNGPNISLNASEVLIIKYSNGSVEDLSKTIGFTNKDSCDKIILKDGKVILAKVFPKNNDNYNEYVMYRNCGEFTGRPQTLWAKDISMVKYSNGITDDFSKAPKSYGFGFTTIAWTFDAIGAVSILTAIVLGPLAILFGSLYFTRKRKSERQYKWEAITAIIFGIVIFIVSAIIWANINR